MCSVTEVVGIQQPCAEFYGCLFPGACLCLVQRQLPGDEFSDFPSPVRLPARRTTATVR